MSLRIILIASLFLASCSGLQRKNSGGATVAKEVNDQSLPTGKDDPLKRRVLMLPFLDADATRPIELRDSAREAMIQSMYGSPDVLPVIDESMQIDLKAVSRLGEYDLKSIAQQASSMGVNAILEGKIMSFRAFGSADPVGIIRQVKAKFEIQARIRVVSAGNGKELLNSVKTVSLEKSDVRFGEKVDLNSFLKSNPDLVAKLAKEVFVEFVPAVTASLAQVQWEGRIAMVTGDRIFLNVGKLSGITVGEILKVTDEGDEIYDPQSGNYIGKVPGRLKGTVEVVSYFGKDGAIAVVHSGSGFRENDRVEPYNR